jgi:hypothetical protein
MIGDAKSAPVCLRRNMSNIGGTGLKRDEQVV